MEKNITIMETELPQLRQMVLENTERINKNEKMINKMRMENVQQSQKISEHDKWMENLTQAQDRFFQRFDERLEKSSAVQDRFLQNMDKRIEESSKKQELLIQHMDESIEKTREAQDRFLQNMDKRIEESRSVQDRFLQNMDKRIGESSKKQELLIQHMDESIEKTREMQDRFFQHFDERLDRLDQKSESTRIEHEKGVRELKEMFKETDKQIKDTSLEVKRLSRQLTGTTGHIVEGLVGSSAAKIFKKAGFELHDSGKNLKRKLKAENIAMEVDVMLSNETTAIPIEVKANFTKEDVDRFLHQMDLFRKLFPECSDMEIIAGIAALNYENGVAEYAHEQGLLVIRVSSDDIFTLDPVDKSKLHIY